VNTDFTIQIPEAELLLLSAVSIAETLFVTYLIVFFNLRNLRGYGPIRYLVLMQVSACWFICFDYVTELLK
jgi:hypothetical protein